MALFDANLLFFHTGNVYNLTASEYVNLTGTTGTSTSTVINLGNARDLGIGSGAEIPQVVVSIGTAITSSSASMLVNLQFQGSTNSTAWNTYLETTPSSTASFAAGSAFIFPVPRRPPGVSLPLYYQLVVNVTGGANVASISTGTIFSGINLSSGESAGTLALYQSGFSVS